MPRREVVEVVSAIESLQLWANQPMEAIIGGHREAALATR
jgi:hypothetical protein